MLEVTKWGVIVVVLTIPILILTYLICKVATFGVLQAYQNWRDDRYERQLSRAIDKRTKKRNFSKN